MENEIIRPLRKKCECGKKVLNHHWLCDKCWGKKAKEKYLEKYLESKLNTRKPRYAIQIVTPNETQFLKIMDKLEGEFEKIGKIILNPVANELYSKKFLKVEQGVSK